MKGSRDPKVKKEGYKVLLEFYSRKIELAHIEDKKGISNLFLKRARIYKDLKQEEGYYAEMSLHYLYESTYHIKDLGQAIESINKALEHAEKSKNTEIIHKIEGVSHKLKSYNSSTFEEAISEIEEEIKVIDKTTDKFGKETALADLSFLKARFEKEPIKKVSLMKEAAEYYQKAGFPARAHRLMGDAFQLEGNKLSPENDKHAELYQKARDEYAKAGNTRLQKWVEGHYHIALATKLGVIANDNEAFQRHLILANHAYKDAGNEGGVQFTAGVGIFLDAVRADFPQSTELFKSAAECLESVGEMYLASFARAEIARIKAWKSEKKEERNAFLLEEKNLLERAIIEGKNKDSKHTLTLYNLNPKISPKTLQHLNQARLEELSGFLDEDREVARTHFKRAKEQYLALESSTVYQNLVLSGLGWTSLFLEDIVDAKKYFKDLERIEPNNPNIKLGEEALDNLIEFKYSEKTEALLIRNRISTPLIVNLINDISVVKNDKPYPTEFFNICLAIIKRSCNQVERFKRNFFNSDEPSIRNEILMLSNSIAEEALEATFTGETFTGKGKSDIFAKNSQDDEDYFIGECKIWKSPTEYKEGFKQLTTRYLTVSEKAGVLITFVKKSTIETVQQKAVEAIQEIDSETKINKIDNKTFISVHKENRLIFHRFVDIIS